MSKFEFYNIPLFKGMDKEEITKCFLSLNSHAKKYNKGQIILQAGTTTTNIGIVMSGSVNVEFIDFLGNRTILAHLDRYRLFAEVYAILKDEKLPVDIVASEECSAILLDMSKLENYQSKNEMWANKLTTNLLIMALKSNIQLSKRSFCIANKTLRGKITSYLEMVSKQSNSKIFTIPFNRQQLADFLNVDRSALSSELSQMKKEGIIDYHKFSFRILK